MPTTREAFFTCVFSSPSSRHVAHIRAWDAGEAEVLFRAELAAEGVEEVGTVSVFPLRAEARERAPRLDGVADRPA